LTQKNKKASQDFGVQRGTIMVIIETEFMDLKKISKTFTGIHLLTATLEV
jgi:hypothetical protein